MHPDYAFTEASFRTRSLSTPLVEPRLARLVMGLLARRIVPFLGAGLSASSPANAPAGGSLAQMLAAHARAAGLGPELAALPDPDDLGEVARVIEGRLGRPVLERLLVNLVSWSARPFNLGHLVIALLYGEQLISMGFTTNWDPLIRRAADTVAGVALSCPCDIPTLRATTPPMLVHLHGDVEHPDSLVATSAQVDAPDARLWTEAQLQAALTVNELLLVGFGVSPEYIVRTIEKVFAIVNAPPAAVIDIQAVGDFVARAPRLAAAAQVDVHCTHYAEGSATEMLAEALRACYAGRTEAVLAESESRVRALAGARVTDVGIQRVRDVVMDGSLSELLGALWRGAFLPTGAAHVRQPTLVGTRDPLASAVATLMLLASAEDVASLERRPHGFRVQHAGDPFDVWIVLPPERMVTLAAARGTAQRSARFTPPADAGVPLMLVCANTDGLPPRGGHAHLVGAPPPGTPGSAMRQPSEVLTLDSLHDRVGSLAASVPYTITSIFPAL